MASALPKSKTGVELCSAMIGGNSSTAAEKETQVYAHFYRQSSRAALSFVSATRM